VLAISGEGRSWSVIHNGAQDAFSDTLKSMGGEIVESRPATLEEVFVSKVGRDDLREQTQAKEGAK